MNPESQQLFEAYVHDQQDLPLLGYTLEALPHLRRHIPLGAAADNEALLCFARLSPGEELAQIQAQIDFFQARGQDFEWKVYALDQPTDLKQMLESQGFQAGDPEVFMTYSLRGACRPTRALPAGIEIRRIEQPEQLGDILLVQAQIWGRDFEWLRAKLTSSLEQPESISLFCAYAEGQAIASGWTDYPVGSRFAELHGGAVLPAWRGRGVFSALLDVRISDAAPRGYEWLAVDAAPMSRPILLAQGFTPICMTWPMRWTHTQACAE
nr:GNAT family N-acetyltransferase [uncultured Roseateles sp.]